MSAFGFFCASIASAQIDPKLNPQPDALEKALRAQEMRHADLYIGNVLLSTEDLAARAEPGFAQEALGGLAGLGVAPSGARFDARTGRWGTLLPSVPLLPGRGRGNTLRWESSFGGPPADSVSYERVAWERLITYLQADALRGTNGLAIDIAELEAPGRVTVHGDGELIQIHANRRIQGIPVRDSYLFATINHGNLVLLGTRNWGDVNLVTAPRLSLRAATSRLRGELGELVVDDGSWGKPHLVILPMARGGQDLAALPLGQGLSYRLAWALYPSFGDQYTNYEALIDAESGEMLGFQDQNRYSGTPSVRTVIGGVFPVSNDGVGNDGTEQAGWPLPHADMTVGGETFTTDSGGNLLMCASGSISTALTGTFLNMNDGCGAINESTSGAVLDFGVSGGTDCTVPSGAGSAGDTHAARSGFYELNRLMAMARGQLPGNTWLRGPLDANMNSTAMLCNAFFNAGDNSVTFMRSGGGCANTGELAGVFDHEWTHVMDFNDANGVISSPGEGIADIFAVLRLDEPCVGRGFLLGTNCGGFGDACLACDGVRDIDWENHASGLPHDIAWIDANCSTGPAPCGGGVHCEGIVTSESIYDLYKRDLQTLYSMDAETARELATRLTYRAAGMVTNWFSCVDGTGMGDGCNADSGYLNLLAADDDNGDLNDGTPHMQALFDAFDRHGIACATPTVQDSGCVGTPTEAPVLTAAVRDRGVTISWPEVSGATKYRVYRSDGLSETVDLMGGGGRRGKSVLGEPIGPPPPTAEEILAGPPMVSFDDDELLNGRSYFYTVYAIGPGDSCLGPASAILTVVPSAGLRIGINPASVSVGLSGGDEDEFLDNCEQGQVSFAIENLGMGTISNVILTGISSPSHPTLDAGITFSPSVAASLDPCEQGMAQFDVVAAGIGAEETVEFEVCFNADAFVEQCATLTLEAEVDFTFHSAKTYGWETDLENWTVTGGTFTRTDTFGGGGGSSFALASSSALNNQCDQVRSQVLRLTPTSTLSLQTHFDIEPMFNTSWYDRANVGIYNPATGDRTTVDPDTGRLYNASGGTAPGCGISGQGGWADGMQTWAQSSWSAAALGSAGFAGTEVQIDVRFGTDSTLPGTGFRIDEVILTQVELRGPDGQSCVAPPLFSDGFESGDFSAWSGVN